MERAREREKRCLERSEASDAAVIKPRPEKPGLHHRHHHLPTPSDVTGTWPLLCSLRAFEN